MSVGSFEAFPTTYQTAECQNCKTTDRNSSAPWETKLRDIRTWLSPWSIQLLSHSCPTSIQLSTI